MKTVGLTFPSALEFKCPYCEKVYKTEDGLKKHIAEKHPDKQNEE